MDQSTEELSRRDQKMFRQRIQNSQQRTAQIARDSDAKRSASMGAHWSHVQAEDEQQRGFVNYLGDRTDVAGTRGVSHNVQGGGKHYYQDRNGTIIGTNSECSRA